MKLYCPHCKGMQHLYISQKILATGTIVECVHCKEPYSLKFTRHVKPLIVIE